MGSTNPDHKIQQGIAVDVYQGMDIFVQGGALGEIGFQSAQSSSVAAYGDSQLPNMYADNFYSGSFHYEMSFLDKSHTLILDLDKNTELPNSIGDKGLLVIPNHLHAEVAFNLDFYLQKAGIIDNASNSTLNIENNINID